MKRKRKARRDERVEKRQKTVNEVAEPPTWLLLRQYYTKVLTLRQYLVRALSGSKKRQRKLLHYGKFTDKRSASLVDPSVIHLLDSVVVGAAEETEPEDDESIEKDITLFTQQLSESSLEISATQGAFKQHEIVDFTLWLIFRRNCTSHRPQHLLSHGFQRHAGSSKDGTDPINVPGAPGIWSICTNPHYEALKKHPWTALPALLGRNAERIIGQLLLDCGLFQSVIDSSNLSQLSGVPLSDLKTLKHAAPQQQRHVDLRKAQSTAQESSLQSIRKDAGLSSIRFVRHRMLYARPTLTKAGKVLFGLGQFHALNRNKDAEDRAQTACLLRYVFPRASGLHNVFTSKNDWKDSAHAYKDYTIRDRELNRAEIRWKEKKARDSEEACSTEQPLPKRLRHGVEALIHRMRRRHAKCSYGSLFAHYCQKSKASVTNGSIAHATPSAQVSAFCRAAVFKVFPLESWGQGDVRRHNVKILSRMIDRFVRFRRHETMSLHDVLQDIKIASIAWLAPATVSVAAAASKTDMVKRSQLMAELLYYLFDSFLVPLIRGFFYVTESSVQRNQLLYFRHDIWKAISEPALTTLTETMLEKCSASQIRRGLARRKLDIGRVRMLPKEQGMRPILNLKRRVQKLKHGQVVLERSTNSILAPVFSILNYERTRHPEALSSALLSVEDMYPRLQAFRRKLQHDGLMGRPLYFAKVDVKACFDTIPQKRLIQLARTIIGAEAYQIAKYNQAKLIGNHSAETPGFGTKPSWKYLTKATSAKEGFDYAREIEADSNEGRGRTVYVDGVVQHTEYRRNILTLLEEHIEDNLIKIGRGYYRQKQGIPQGSVVSSLLCSYFYAVLEREHLDFIRPGESIVLRLIDDFLVISTRREIAEKFMHVMHGGLPSFGVQVKADKSRTNFDLAIDGKAIPRSSAECDFPYCGNTINTVTLDLSKDRERAKQSNISDSTNVEYSRLAGQSFYRKILDALKLHMKAMLLSTNYNSLPTVLSNLHHSFAEVAEKTYHYICSLPGSKQPGSSLVIKTVDDVIKLACVFMKKRRSSKDDIMEYACSVTHAQARWLACCAFRNVFQRRQTKHRALLAWLNGQMRLPEIRAQGKGLTAVVERYK